MVTKSGTDEIPFYWMIRASPENSLFDYQSRLLICNRNPFAAIKSRSYEFERLFEAEEMNGGERWAFARSDGLLEAECTVARWCVVAGFARREGASDL